MDSGTNGGIHGVAACSLQDKLTYCLVQEMMKHCPGLVLSAMNRTCHDFACVQHGSAVLQQFENLPQPFP